jgi:hypothetical protein
MASAGCYLGRMGLLLGTRSWSLLNEGSGSWQLDLGSVVIDCENLST